MNFGQKVCFWCFIWLIITDVILTASKKEDKKYVSKKQDKKVHNRKFINKHKRINEKVSESNQETQLRVQIQNGATIIGAINKTVDQQKPYYSFRKIPYAEPPIGDLRFRPPVPLSGNLSHRIINSTEDGPSCLQSVLLPSAIIGSEDCLYINVYTPQAPHQNASLLPVMVWIYGGAFVVGDGAYPEYGPDYLLNEDVIVVTLNYRVGILGFLSTGDDASPGNYGLKDQVLGLKWINENIRSFGGDPNRTTIFGESAGAASVSYLTQTNLTKGLFNAAILESGSSLVLWGLTRHPRSMATTVGFNLGVDIRTSQTLVDGLRKIDSRRLQRAEMLIFYEQIVFNNDLDGLPFGPTIEHDHPDAIVLKRSHDRLEKGLFHHVPHIIGFNSLEAMIFLEIFNLVRWYLVRYDLSPTALVPASFNIDDNLIASVEVNRDIKSHYFGAIPITLSGETVFQFVSDAEFVRPILETALLCSKFAPVYLYQFSYEGYLGSGNRTIPGVGHAEELAYIWRESLNKAKATPSDVLTRQRMVRLWTNFAKTGNPTPTDDPILQNVTWPLASSAGANNLAYINIGNNLTTSVNPGWENFVYWKNLFNKYGNPPYDTY